MKKMFSLLSSKQVSTEVATLLRDATQVSVLRHGVMNPERNASPKKNALERSDSDSSRHTSGLKLALSM